MVMSCLDTDLAALFSSKEFGEDRGSVIINGVEVQQAFFDDEDVEVPGADGITRLAHAAYVTAPTALLPVLVQGQPAVIRGDRYTVQYWKNDGNGVTVVYLEKV
jgi:hypothetical protein